MLVAREIRNKAISASNQFEVEAELGKKNVCLYNNRDNGVLGPLVCVCVIFL